MDQGIPALFVLPIVSGLVAYALTPLAAWLSVRVGAVDLPDARKVHQHPMPRLGGSAVIAAVAFVLVLAPMLGGGAWAIPEPLVAGLVLGLLPIVAVSVADDIRQVPARIKFLCHLLGAVVAVACGISLPQTLHVLGYEFSIGLLAVPLSVIWLAGVTNAFNIIDGLDGLAAGLAFISATAVSAVLLTSGQWQSALLTVALAGALAGFLPYNLYPARIFLGDTGATAIGFTLAVMTLKGGSTMSVGFATATPILILGLPLADTGVAIVRRLFRWAEHRVGGVFQADRNHVHHRLLALGLNHRQAVLVLHGLGLVTAAIAYWSLFLSNRDSALLLLGLLIAGAIGLKRLGYDEFALVRRGTFLRLYEAPVLRRAMFIAFVDLAFVCLSVYLAVCLKTDDWMLTTHRDLVFRMTAMLVPISVLVFWKTRLYEGSWRLATIDDYVRASVACGLAVFVALMLCLWRFQDVPASLLIVYGLVSAFFVVGSRASYRVLVSAQRSPGTAGTPALIFGPGPDDFLQARDVIDRAGSFGLRPVGFLTPTGLGRGQLLAGIMICGSLDELPLIARATHAQVALMARRPPMDLAERFRDLCGECHIDAYRLNTELEAMHPNDDGIDRDDAPPNAQGWPSRAEWPLYDAGFAASRARAASDQIRRRA